MIALADSIHIRHGRENGIPAKLCDILLGTDRHVKNLAQCNDCNDQHKAGFLSGGMAPLPSGALSVGLCLLAHLLMKLLPAAMCDVRQVELRVEERSIILPAMVDSGNLLSDPVTGLPVLVIPQKAAHTLFPDVRDLSCLSALPLGFRLLSVRTAAGSSLLPMFRPDECRIYVNGNACKARLLAAVAGRDYSGVQALVPLSALPSGTLPT